jgi:hypothetical protein
VNIRSKKEEKISNKDIHYNSRVTREVHVETYGTSRRLGTARNSKLETTDLNDGCSFLRMSIMSSHTTRIKS